MVTTLPSAIAVGCGTTFEIDDTDERARQSLKN